MNLKTWGKNIALGIDQLGNTVLRGNPDETISSRAGRVREQGKLWGCVLCKFLDWLDPDHCNKAIEPGKGSK
jgi:hypothetical protein